MIYNRSDTSFRIFQRRSSNVNLLQIRFDDRVLLSSADGDSYVDLLGMISLDNVTFKPARIYL